jgi:hypothetical protein
MTDQFIDMLAAHGIVHCKTSATHSIGGVLDIVALRADTLQSHVGINNVGLSDHWLLRWTMPLARPSPVCLSTTGRLWSRQNRDPIRAAVRSSQLGRRDSWSVLNLERQRNHQHRGRTDSNHAPPA